MKGEGDATTSPANPASAAMPGSAASAIDPESQATFDPDQLRGLRIAFGSARLGLSFRREVECHRCFRPWTMRAGITKQAFCDSPLIGSKWTAATFTVSSVACATVASERKKSAIQWIFMTVPVVNPILLPFDRESDDVAARCQSGADCFLG